MTALIKYNYKYNLNIKRCGLTIPDDVSYEEDLPTKTILLVGNGFDLRAGIKSSFKDFIFFVIYGCALHNIRSDTMFAEIQESEYVKVKNTYPCQLDILINLKDSNICSLCSEFADNILGRLIIDHLFVNETFCNLIPHFCSYLKNRVVTKDECESIKTMYGLNYIRQIRELEVPRNELNNGIGTLIYLIERERNLLNNNPNIEYWLDIESVIEMIVTDSEELKKKYGFDTGEVIKWNLSTSKCYMKGLELFEMLLTEYLKEAQKIDVNPEKVQEYFDSLRDSHLHSLVRRSHGRIIDFNLLSPDILINYNYTNIAERYYKSLKIEPTVFHINGALLPSDEIRLKELNTNIVIGYTNSNKRTVSKEAFPFEKSSRRIIKNTDYVDIDSIIESDTFDLIVFGHSCGVADSDVISKLLSSDRLKTAVILCHSYTDLVLSFNNIKAMLTEEKFNDLMTFSKNDICNNLYFSVENKD